MWLPRDLFENFARLEAALVVRPRDVSCMISLAAVRKKQGDAREALAVLERAAALAPLPAHLDLARRQLGAHQPEERGDGRLDGRLTPLEGEIAEVRGAVPAFTRQPNSPRREQARERVHEETPNPELVCDGARVLPAGAAKHDQVVIAEVVAVGQYGAADGLGRVHVGHVYEALGDFIGALTHADLRERGAHGHEGVVDGRAMEGEGKPLW